MSDKVSFHAYVSTPFNMMISFSCLPYFFSHLREGHLKDFHFFFFELQSYAHHISFHLPSLLLASPALSMSLSSPSSELPSA